MTNEEIRSKLYAKGYMAIFNLEVLIESEDVFIPEWKKEELKELTKEWRKLDKELFESLVSE